MDDPDLQRRFEVDRGRLRGLAYRMLGSLGDVDDAIQETWLRLDRTDAARIQNLEGWLTTTTTRVCLNMIRARTARAEVQLETSLPDPVVAPVAGGDPEQELLVSEGVGLALQVVLDTLGPAERTAFVLHDMFGFAFADIAPLVERTPTAARKLASRARRRVAGVPLPDADHGRQREVVDAYFAAARRGEFEALLELLHPEVVMRSDGGALRPRVTLVRVGREAVAEQARGFAPMARFARPVLVNGAAGAVVAPNGHPVAVMGFVVRGDTIRAIDVLADPARLPRLGLAELASEVRRDA